MPLGAVLPSLRSTDWEEQTCISHALDRNKRGILRGWRVPRERKERGRERFRQRIQPRWDTGVHCFSKFTLLHLAFTKDWHRYLFSFTERNPKRKSGKRGVKEAVYTLSGEGDTATSFPRSHMAASRASNGVCEHRALAPFVLCIHQRDISWGIGKA